VSPCRGALAYHCGSAQTGEPWFGKEKTNCSDGLTVKEKPYVTLRRKIAVVGGRESSPNGKDQFEKGTQKAV